LSLQPTASTPRKVSRLLTNFAPQDWLVLGYLTFLNLALLVAKGDGVTKSALRMGALLLTCAVVVVSVRARWFTHGLWAPLAYRLSLQGIVQFSYFFLGAYLPLVNPRSLDASLYSIDLRYFGFEGCLWADAHISPFASEWFAFFYFCYFFLLLSHSIPIVMFSRNERLLSEFGIGILTLFCVGQVVYALVPGYGPVRELAPVFSGKFPHGLWLDSVMRTVASGGAQKDIFPSLHTAAPTFLTLFSYRHRRQMPFGYTWPVVGFFALNIIAATMYLRWHWVIDVAAGLVLAGLGWWLGVAVTAYELRRRRLNRLPASWPLFGIGRS
jgi:membrane-associated phospholipid phosphatase